MKHYLILALLLIAGLNFYMAGIISSSILLLCIGAFLEMNVWKGLFRRHRKRA